MEATTEHPIDKQPIVAASDLSEYVNALEALRKRHAKYDKAAARLKRATAQVEALQGKAEEAAKRRAATLIAAWSRGKSELTDAERRRLDEEEQSLMATAYDSDITEDQLPVLKAYLQQEAEALDEEWRELRKIARTLTLEEIERGITHDIAALSDSRLQLFEIEQLLANIRDKCAAGEYFRNNEQGEVFIGPGTARSPIDGQLVYVDRRGDPGKIAEKHGVEELLNKYRPIFAVSVEADRQNAWEIASYYTAIGVPIYSREERELERKSYVNHALRHRIRTHRDSASDAHGVINATLNRRIDEIDQAAAALRALQAKPF